MEHGRLDWGVHGGLESGIPELPYRETGARGMHRRVGDRRHLVRYNKHSTSGRPGGLGYGDTCGKMAEDQRSCRGGGPVPSWLGEMG